MINMATCKNFNTINSTDINEIKAQLLNFESYVFIHTSSDYRYTYNCTIDILLRQEHCNLTLVDIFSYDSIYYFNITLENACIYVFNTITFPLLQSVLYI